MVAQVALAQAEGEFYRIKAPLLLYRDVSPSKELRDASREVAVQAEEYSIDVSMRLDLFKAKQFALDNIEKSGMKLGPEEQRLVEMIMKQGTRAGLALSEKERGELARLKKELSNACSEYNVRRCQDTCTLVQCLPVCREISGRQM